MKKLVGQVTEEEKNEIQALFERKNGLAERCFFFCFPVFSGIIDRVLSDFSAHA